MRFDETRPAACPPGARWSERDHEWVDGDRDAQGRLTGLVRYWDADGALISECDHIAGRPHGAARRYFPDGTLAQECRYVHGVIDGVRRMHRPRLDDSPTPTSYAAGPWWRRVYDDVTVCELIYEAGDLIGSRYLDRDGVEVDPYGGEVSVRPAGVPPTAAETADGRWLFQRRRGEAGDVVLESCEWSAAGELDVERSSAGHERAYHPGGQLRAEGDRGSGGDSRTGIWRFYDPAGLLRRVSEYDHTGDERTRTWHRTGEEAGGYGTTRRGPVADGFEIGRWEVSSDDGQTETVELGQPCRRTDLVDGAAAADHDSVQDLARVARQLEADDPGGPAAMLAWLRLAGRTADRTVVTTYVRSDRPWPEVDENGRHRSSEYLDEPVDCLRALRWGAPREPTLVALVNQLCRARRDLAALDVIDAALLVGHVASDGAGESSREQWSARRVNLLCGLDRADEAIASIADIVGQHRVDERTESLLLAIRADPDDDAARLAYAAHVSHLYPEHSRMILAQIGNNVGENGDVTRPSGTFDVLSASVPHSLRSLWEPVRGFSALASVYLGGDEFLRHHDLVFRLCPLATRLVLFAAGNELRVILQLPALHRYSGLALMETRLWSRGADWLARSPELVGLTELSLANTGLDDDTLPTVLDGTAYPRLRGLDLSDARAEQDWTLTGLAALPAAAFAATLERLMIGGRWQGDDVVEFLAALPNLAELGLDRGSLTDGGLEYLAVLNHRYRSVDLRQNEISAEGMVGFLESPVVTGLTRLEIGGNGLGDDGYAAAVTAASSMPLRHLDLSGDLRRRPGSATGAALGRAAFVDTLGSLDLSLGEIGVDGSLALANAPWHCLESLNLYGNGIGDDGAVALAGAPSMARLRILNLGNNQLTDRAGLALAQSPYLHSIHLLELGGADLSDDTIETLTNRFGEHVQFRYPWD